MPFKISAEQYYCLLAVSLHAQSRNAGIVKQIQDGRAEFQTLVKDLGIYTNSYLMMRLEPEKHNPQHAEEAKQEMDSLLTQIQRFVEGCPQIQKHEEKAIVDAFKVAVGTVSTGVKEEAQFSCYKGAATSGHATRAAFEEALGRVHAATTRSAA